MVAQRSAGRLELAIKENHTTTSYPCALCGHSIEPNLGPELFLAQSWQLVCWNCGLQVDYPLVMMLLWFYEQMGKLKEQWAKPHDWLAFRVTAGNPEDVGEGRARTNLEKNDNIVPFRRRDDPAE
ncbi:MAG: hypothetical protein M3220_17965 [Chloroflexota bacterium]|nr:hypothetical protein [Chloroflexota bacterium]